ncbi:hypothetical protein V1279_002993 [Bradyrhizobium sp. AZCC 1610]|uniref:hypothetical protein n=1 Tax=Bradyrhizobium sp. AZCC 1610 TaxID=3117020 RepID=UPI002FEF75C9
MSRRKNQPETNVEFVTRLMEFSNYGALAQIFVIEALRRWSDLVADAEPAKVDSPMISGHAWVGVAKEIKAKLEERV